MTTKLEITHFRRCHVCGAVNEKAQEEVTRCKSCDKPLAPFFYFSPLDLNVPTDEAISARRNLPALMQNLLRSLGQNPLRFGLVHRPRRKAARSFSVPSRGQSPYEPLQGLFAVWDGEDEDS